MKRSASVVRPRVVGVAVLGVLAALALAGCKAGGRSGGGVSGGGDSGCTGSCAETSGAFLSAAEVTRVLDQAAYETDLRALGNMTVAVVDRVGNVLAVARIGAARTVRVSAERGVTGGLEGVDVPDAQAAIAKAVTAAYLSSEGNAFSSRTANQIVQEYFNPGEAGAPAGPLYGVQFSQLPCSDVNTRGAGVAPGPKRSPLGLSADPGGLPLYENGTPVGGVGVVIDDIYGLDRDIDDGVGNDRNQADAGANNWRNLDEIVALAASRGFEAPTDRRADRISVDGRTLRFADAAARDLVGDPARAPAFGASGAALVAAGDFPGGAVLAGTAFGSPASGFQPADDDFVPAGPGARSLDAFVLVDGAGANRFPPAASALLTGPQVRALLQSALRVANRARAQIRRPLGTPARVTVAVVGVDGTVLGLARTRDAPVFGTDVAVQKARSAAFFSRPTATVAADLTAVRLAGGIDYGAEFLAMGVNALPGTEVAFSSRALGNLARPFFPDGVVGKFRGPFSVDHARAWSPFNTGLQLDALLDAGGLADSAGCALPGLANGLQIFAGGIPLYVGGVPAGAIGVSGDGIDQDDMVAFLGLQNAGLGLTQAPSGRRADALPGGYRVRDSAGNPDGSANVRYVQCPRAPFIDSSEEGVCDGL